MDDQNNSTNIIDISKNYLPDVVNSQQKPSLEAEMSTEAGAQSQSFVNTKEKDDISAAESEIESISEHLPSKIDDSVSRSEIVPVDEPPDSLNLQFIQLQTKAVQNTVEPFLNEPNAQNLSPNSLWNMDMNLGETQLITDISPVLIDSSDPSKEQEGSHLLEPDSLRELLRQDFPDSLNEQSNKSLSHHTDSSFDKDSISAGENKQSSSSEEIIKLDIRGTAVPMIAEEKIIFGLPPERSQVIDPNIDALPIFANLIPPLLIATDNITDELVFESTEQRSKEPSPEKSIGSCSDKSVENDLLVEEITVDDTIEASPKEKLGCETNRETNPLEGEVETDRTSIPPKSLAPESLTATEYKNISEEFQSKLDHFEAAIGERDSKIKHLETSLQLLKQENDYLTEQNLQMVGGTDLSHDNNDNVTTQISDYMKYNSLVNETKFYTAIASGSSLHSSNGEKDMDNEEVTVNYSKSDVMTSEDSNIFTTGFEDKLTNTLTCLEQAIDENILNNVKEQLMKIYCEEIGKIRIESDTEIKEIEVQMIQDKSDYKKETIRLEELLDSVKSGNCDIENLRSELNKKHSREMENLREYFEKKCTEMEKSYSEDVWRKRSEGVREEPDAAGDAPRNPPVAQHTYPQPSQTEPVQQMRQKYEEMMEQLKSDHLAHVNQLHSRHRDAVDTLHQQISELKARIQTAENTEPNTEYHQDIDSELEKEVTRRVALARDEILIALQDQIKVLLSEPDAELSSWPLELVALRDKLCTERKLHDSQVTSAEPGEDKWRQRRNHSFDQNRQLEEVTKERDSFKRVAVSLQRVVSHLVSYCSAAEDEINRTVLTELLTPSHHSCLETSSAVTPRNSVDGRHVHFAPCLPGLVTLEEDELMVYLQRDRDLSLDIKTELELSLNRLKDEAQQLLELSSRLGTRNQSNMLEMSNVQIEEVVDEDTHCDSCDIFKKNLKEMTSEYVQREGALRSDLESALLTIAHLTAHDDLVAHGYGVGESSSSLPARPARVPPSTPPSPRDALTLHIDRLQRENVDLRQQLESANRQLRSSRQFIEELTVDRETERDEAARRIQQLSQDNSRLTQRLQNNATIMSEVEQLEAQTREMNQIISDLEKKKTAVDDELESADEKISLLRDIISTLEGTLEQKSVNEKNILKQLEEMKNTIDERDSKMRALVGELEMLRSERDGRSSVSICEKCAGEDKDDLIEKIKDEVCYVEGVLSRRVSVLENIHETCSASCSEPSEDVSLRDQRNINLGMSSPTSPRDEPTVPWLSPLRETLRAVVRAEDAVQRRVHDLQMMRDQLAHIAQEVRAERDVLQSRLSEQALTISSLGARLDQQRQTADSRAHTAVADLTVQLHDVTAQVQRLKEEVESKDIQLSRLKQTIEERADLNEIRDSLYGNNCNPIDKVIILERELLSCQSQIATLEGSVRLLQDEKADLARLLEDKDRQMQELLALNLEEDRNDQKSDNEQIKSGRTLSDIVSISDFDEQDLQMRRMELRNQNVSIQKQQHSKDHDNMTLPPDIERPNMSSLHLEHIDYFDLPNCSPKADSLPNHLTSTQNKDVRVNFNRNINETTIFGVEKSNKIQDNCSMHPNKDVSDKNVSVAPKILNFSIEPSKENQEFLKELGISLDMNQDNFPDILTQLKAEMTKSKNDLKKAVEQLAEFPAIIDEVDNLKNTLENTISTMKTDKKYYENQLEMFTANETILEQKITELTTELKDKSQDLQLLKEDILKRENMIMDLAKERRNLSNKMSELQSTIDELQTKNNNLEKYELENRELREKVTEYTKLEQLITEKNQQIESLNQHLDRLDDLQRSLNDKSEQFDNLKDAFEEKSNEMFQLQDTIDALNRDIQNLNEENDKLNLHNKELKLKVTKLEKEQENQSLKMQNNENELERVNSINTELSTKITELKQLNERLKDKETEIEILNEDIKAFHEEIDSLKDQLSIVSRSPSPKKEVNKERQALNDTKQLVKIRKQITLLQHELDFNKKELNDKAFELARAQLDLGETKNSLSAALTRVDESQLQLRHAAGQLDHLTAEKEQLDQQIAVLLHRLREESNLEELKQKLRLKSEQCDALERQVTELKAKVQSDTVAVGEMALVRSVTRSPTLELERALHNQLHYSHALDDHIEQILSASSDNDGIPRLALNSSKSSSIQSSESERLCRLRTENERLQLQVDALTARLHDKDALIHELNRVRDKLLQECESANLKFEAERDNASRLQLLLDNYKDTAETLQKQDCNMISMLKKRLESAMRAEVQVQLDAQVRRDRGPADAVHQNETISRLESEMAVLRSRVEMERNKASEAALQLDQLKTTHHKELEARKEQINALRTELAELRRLKHEAGIELLRAKELLNIQNETIKQLENKLEDVTHKHYTDTTEIHEKPDLFQEIATLKRCVLESTASERTEQIAQLKTERDALTERVHRLEQELRTAASEADKEQAIRYLNGRVLRLESCRKALVWQKRYLQRVVTGYRELEERLSLPTSGDGPALRGLNKFRSAVSAVIVLIRMKFLVQRRMQIRQFTSAAILPRPHWELHPVQSPLSRSRTTDCMARKHVPHPRSSWKQETSHNRSPKHEPFLLSSQRKEAAAYLSKLDLVGRCISQAMDANQIQ